MNTILKRNTVLLTLCQKIGGLFGLWFGISFVDMSQLFRKISTFVKNFLLAHIDFNRIITTLIRFRKFKMVMLIIYWMNKIMRIINIIDKINWNSVIKVLTLPFMLYQIWDLTDDYLKYPMDVSVEWFPYKDTNFRLSDESIPAITVCYEHIFERILFDENVQASFRYNLNLTIVRNFFQSIENKIQTKDPYIQNLIVLYLEELKGTDPAADLNPEIQKTILYYLDVNNRTEFIERQFRLNDKTFDDFNGIQRQLNFFSYIQICKLGVLFKENIYCNDFRKDVELISPFGKCQTYFSEINQAESKINKTFKIDTVFYIIESRLDEVDFSTTRYFKKKFFIHSYKELPEITTNEFELTDNSVIQLNAYRIAYNRIDFKKLPKPYETNCRNYGKSNRFECLNECYLNGYNQKWNCTPNDNHLLTVVLKNNSIEPKVKFCHKTDKETQEYNNFLRNYCFKECLESCEHAHFFISIEPDNHHIEEFTFTYFLEYKFILKEKFYSKIIFNPRITFIDLIISITNILSLWHGISFLSIFSNLLVILAIILSKFKVHIKQNIRIKWSWLKVNNFLHNFPSQFNFPS